MRFFAFGILKYLFWFQAFGIFLTKSTLTSTFQSCPMRYKFKLRPIRYSSMPMDSAQAMEETENPESFFKQLQAKFKIQQDTTKESVEENGERVFVGCFQALVNTEMLASVKHQVDIEEYEADEVTEQSQNPSASKLPRLKVAIIGKGMDYKEESLREELAPSQPLFNPNFISVKAAYDCTAKNIDNKKFDCMKRQIHQYTPSPETIDATDAGTIILSYQKDPDTGTKLFHADFVDLLIKDTSESIQVAIEKAVEEQVDMIYIMYDPKHEAEYYTAYKNSFPGKTVKKNQKSIAFKKGQNDILIVSSFGTTAQRVSSVGFEASINEFEDIFTVGSLHNHPTNFKISLKFSQGDIVDYFRGTFITKLVALSRREHEVTLYCLNEFDIGPVHDEVYDLQNNHDLIALIFCNHIHFCTQLLEKAIQLRMKAAFIASSKPLNFLNDYLHMELPIAYLEPEKYKSLLHLYHTSRMLKFDISTSFVSMKDFNYYPYPFENMRPGDAMKLKPDVVTSNLHFSKKEDLIDQLKRKKTDTVVSSARFAGMLLPLLNEKLKNNQVIKRKEILARIQNTATPLLLEKQTLEIYHDINTPEWAVSVLEQGAGIPNIQRATSTKVHIAPPKIELSPEFQGKAQRLTIKNKGEKSVHYTVEHLPAPTIQVSPRLTFLGINKISKRLNVVFRLTTLGQCDSLLSNSKQSTLDFKILPGRKVMLCVYFEADALMLAPESEPYIFNGYIRFLPKYTTENKAPLHVAYKYSTKKLELRKDSL